MLGELFDPKAELQIGRTFSPPLVASGRGRLHHFPYADSIPEEVLQRWEREKQEWIQRRGHARYTGRMSLPTLANKEQRQFNMEFNRCPRGLLDTCHGQCLLRQPELGQDRGRFTFVLRRRAVSNGRLYRDAESRSSAGRLCNRGNDERAVRFMAALHGVSQSIKRLVRKGSSGSRNRLTISFAVRNSTSTSGNTLPTIQPKLGLKPGEFHYRSMRSSRQSRLTLRHSRLSLRESSGGERYFRGAKGDYQAKGANKGDYQAKGANKGDY